MSLCIKLSFQGDSGGPLVCKGTGDPQEGPHGVLVGVVSGMRMTFRGPGSFFTRTSSYKNYIDSTHRLLLELLFRYGHLF